MYQSKNKSDSKTPYDIRVVKVTTSGPKRAILTKEEYTIKDGRITLPQYYYSAGYYERLTDGVWEDLQLLDS